MDDADGPDKCLMIYKDASDKDVAGRIGQPMARALYSRIMLYMASPRYSSESSITWQQAADAAKGFIEIYGSNYSLMQGTDSKTALTNAWLLTPYEESNKEMIFYRNDGTISWNNIRYDVPVGEGGNGGLCPSQNLIDMYDMIDGNSPFQEYDETGAPIYNGVNPSINAASGYNDDNMWANRDGRLAASILYNGVSWGNGVINVVKGQRDNPVGNANATPTGYYVRKYMPETILSANHSGNSRRLWTIIRYAEILLNYAEAVNEVQGPCKEVYDQLDLIRHRAGITGNVADRTDLNTKEKMRNFIRKERTVELAFEEHRAWDVRRWNVAEKALGRYCLLFIIYLLYFVFYILLFVLFYLLLELVNTVFKSCKFSNVFAVPLTTQSNGSSATYTGISVFIDINLSISFIKAPPPASTIPFAIISEASSGGVFSNVTLTISTILFIDSDIACPISFDVT